MSGSHVPPKKFQNAKSCIFPFSLDRYCLLGVSRVSGECLEAVWMVSGRCLEGVWRVSEGLYVKCQPKKVSNRDNWYIFLLDIAISCKFHANLTQISCKSHANLM